MINKIQIIGKLIFSPKQKEKEYEEIDSTFDIKYYNLMVKVPNGSVTLIRCLLKGIEKIEKWEQELQDNDIVEVKGFLRNEINGRQIIVRVTKWEKMEESFEELDENQCNSVRLVGKVIDLKRPEETETTNNKNVVSFKVVCIPSTQPSFSSLPMASRLNSNEVSTSYFCRVNEESYGQINLQKGDVVLIGGFLQTKKIFDETNKKIE